MGSLFWIISSFCESFFINQILFSYLHCSFHEKNMNLWSGLSTNLFLIWAYREKKIQLNVLSPESVFLKTLSNPAPTPLFSVINFAFLFYNHLQSFLTICLLFSPDGNIKCMITEVALFPPALSRTPSSWLVSSLVNKWINQLMERGKQGKGNMRWMNSWVNEWLKGFNWLSSIRE